MRAPGPDIFRQITEKSEKFLVVPIVAMTVLYFKSLDPLFLVLDAIVLVGLPPSIYVAFAMVRSPIGSSQGRSGIDQAKRRCTLKEQ